MNRLKQLDLACLWHPFTQQTEWGQDLAQHPLIIARAKGHYLYDHAGRKYLDAVSSLWCNLHGHRHPKLDKALAQQMRKMAHTTFLGLTHEPGIRLAQELLAVSPQGLSRVFYSDNGSTANEVALKMIYQFHAQKKERSFPKTEFIALKNSYHGDTLGSVSVGGIELFHKKFKPLLFKTHFAASPHCGTCPYRKKPLDPKSVTRYAYCGESPRPGDARHDTGCQWECLGEIKNLLQKKGSRVAGVIVEPIVQGAAGILVAPPGYLSGLSKLCSQHHVPLIADEVAVGFGRTGKLFACEHENVRPDILSLAKGISGGYLPLAATLSTEKIYRGFLGKAKEFKTFFHGHTYTANPLACAVARSSLALFAKNAIIKKTAALADNLGEMLGSLISHPHIGEIRQAGLMAGVEIVADKDQGRSFDYKQRIGRRICLAARSQGLLLRPLNDVIVVMPPLSITNGELKFMIKGIRQSIQRVLKI